MQELGAVEFISTSSTRTPDELGREEEKYQMSPSTTVQLALARSEGITWVLDIYLQLLYKRELHARLSVSRSILVWC